MPLRFWRKKPDPEDDPQGQEGRFRESAEEPGPDVDPPVYHPSKAPVQLNPPSEEEYASWAQSYSPPAEAQPLTPQPPEPNPGSAPAAWDETASQAPPGAVEATNPGPVRHRANGPVPRHRAPQAVDLPVGELGRDAGVVEVPLPEPEVPQPHQEEEDSMSQIDRSIQELLAIDGATGAAIVDISSGMALATGGAPGFDLNVAAAGNSNVVRAKLSTMNDLGLEGKVEDIMITLDGQYHIINVLNAKESAGLFIYLVLDRAKANLALARHKLNRVADAVTV